MPRGARRIRRGPRGTVPRRGSRPMTERAQQPTEADPELIRARVATLGEAEAADRVAWLVPELNRHGQLYHERDAAEIDDRTYDLMYRELELLEARFPRLVR